MWLRENTAVYVRPVVKDIYTIFVKNEKARGHYCPLDGKVDSSSKAGEVTVGMWADDAARFVEWINSLFDDGTAFRLPTQGELADPEMGLVADLAGHSVWMHGDVHPLLYCSDGLS
jgi:hypothetical protein